MGFKASREDVLAADDKDLTVTTKYPTFKVKVGEDPQHHGNLKHTFASDFPAGTHNIFTIPHRLGYVPAHYERLSFDGKTYHLLPLSYDIDIPSGSIKTIRARADEDNLYIELVRSGAVGATTGQIYYITYTISVEPGA